jgi:O-antigen/teichoic acid export membrane protein
MRPMAPWKPAVTAEPAPEPIARRVLLNVLSNYTAKILSLAAWLLLTRFLLLRLGAEQYGLWVLVGSVTAYGSLFDLGIAAAITKYVAEFRARREMERARALIATALWLYLGLGLVVVLLAVLLAPAFPRFFAIQPEQQSTAMWLALLLGIHIGVSIPCAASAAVLQGLQRFDLLNVLNVVTVALSFAATVAVVAADGGVVALAGVGLSLTVLMQLPALLVIRRIAPELPFGLRGADRHMARTVVGFSFPLLLLHVGGHLESRTDEIVIGKFLPLRTIAPYNIARRISGLPLALTEQFLSLLLPLTSSLHAANDGARLRSLYIVSTRLTLAVFIPIGLSLVVLARPILTLWVGEAYGAYAPLVLILTVASLIDTSQWPAGLILQGMARHQPLASMTLASGLSNLALSIFLIGFMGLTGVALGTLIATTIVCLLFVTPYALRVLQVSAREIIWQAWLPALAPAIPALVVAYLLRSLLAPQSVISVASVAGVSCLVFAVVYLALKVNDFERQTCRRFAITLLASVRLQWRRAWFERGGADG